MVHIRLASPGDRAAVEAVVEAAYAPYIPRMGRRPGPMLDDYGALIAGRHVHVLCDEGRIAGILVLIPEEHAMLLDNIAVAPDAQGRGFGGALIAFAEKFARERGLRTIRLYTNEAMTENIALYGRLGFVETHRAEEKGFRRVYMTKLLDARP
ncbi:MULTISPECIES: GNAT family N-acetyltransferase [Microvirga]|uniref:GNAT family N-acetyltransferase n=1 Tax=Microvirga TaxID=186650 RepID=UPI001CFFAC17|nr:GNAT family N-acetyltransferase [Microvirga lenta]MCB5176342.1 GNAT family N-acetyltransferase [Microvirga lenta]